MNYRPMSIKREGLSKYLQRTSDRHNGFAYDEFLKLVEAKVTAANLAKAFKVNRVTITKWLHIHEDELEKAKIQAEHETALEELHQT